MDFLPELTDISVNTSNRKDRWEMSRFFYTVFGGVFGGSISRLIRLLFGGQKRVILGVKNRKKVSPFWGCTTGMSKFGYFGGILGSISRLIRLLFGGSKKGIFGQKRVKKCQKHVFFVKKGDIFVAFWVSRARRKENRISRLIRLLFGVKKGSFFPFFGSQNHVFRNVDLSVTELSLFWGVRGSIFVTFGGGQKGRFLVIFGGLGVDFWSKKGHF